MFTKKKVGKKLAATVLALSLSVTMGATTAFNASALLLDQEGKYYADFASKDEALAAADALNTEISAEGDVLLKNDGTLPFNGNEKISVFGVSQDSMVGAGGSASVTKALANEGFKVNPALEKYYAGVGTTIGKENTVFDKTIESSYDLYGDAAVIILARTGGEGSDLDTGSTKQDVEDEIGADGEGYGWTHEGLFTQDGKTYKHYLQLTDSEEELISYIKANFEKIVVLVNTSNAMELANLQNDDAINAILWIGRPGSTGIAAMAQILNGKVNPSGKLVDEWYRDFTADPTWQNFGYNTQTGSSNVYLYANGEPTGTAESGLSGSKGFHGMDYEEDIYIGYKYYETVYAELDNGTIKYNKTTHKLVAATEELGTDEGTPDDWWNYAVVYPFGYGLSYTTFTQEIGNVYYKTAGGKVELPATLDGSIFASEVGAPAVAEKLYAPVTVTNTGDVAGKQVVEIYVTAPYTAGGVEKAEVVLVGYAKTNVLKPGKSQTVTVEFNVQDFASFDWADKNESGYKGYELDPGKYSIKVMADSHVVLDSQEFTITSEDPIALKIDDFSHNEVVAVFSQDDIYNTVRISKGEGDLKLNVNPEDGNMTLLSREDMVGTFPVTPDAAALTITDNFNNAMAFLDAVDADTFDDANPQYTNGQPYAWYKTDAELKAEMVGWTQSTNTAKDYVAEIQLADMSGVDMKTTEGAAKWVEFMNQLTWDDLTNIDNHGSHTTAAIASIGKTASKDENGPNSYCSKNWCDETVVSSTWNVELGKQYGIINANLGMFSGQQGWYGPGMNMHRSPFAGRNNEYYSQDGIQGGYMAAAVVGGAQSRGLNVYIKHMFINDQETNRNGECLVTWASEAVIRDTYAKCFQMAMQEGGSTSAMTAFARLGRVPASANYRFLTDLVRNEWGWEGAYVTDAWAGLNCCTMDICIRTGNDLPDGTASGAKVVSGTWDATKVGVGTEAAPSGNVILGSDETAHESLLQWYYARTCAQRVLYVAANTQNNKNGVITSGYTINAIEAKQGAAVNASAAMDAEALNGCSATYTATGLPAGLTINESTGAISGTPTQVGTFTATVNVAVASWITASAKVTVTVAPAFTVTATTAEIGEDFVAYVESDVITSANYNNGITYSATGLPTGLTMANNGEITGTPTEKGTFTATITVVASNKTGSGTRAKTEDTTFENTVVFVITGEDAPVVTTKAIVNTEVETANGVTTYTITYDDGTTDVITVTDGKDGKDGKDGAQGAQGIQGEKGETGAQGPKGDKGETGAAGADGKDGAGCSGSVGFGGLVALLMGACAVVALRKKED